VALSPSSSEALINVTSVPPATSTLLRPASKAHRAVATWLRGDMVVTLGPLAYTTRAVRCTTARSRCALRGAALTASHRVDKGCRS